MKKTKGENFIHLKFENGEAVSSKKDLLSVEMNLLNVLKSIGRYSSLRSMELRLKGRFYREMKKMSVDTQKIEDSLPSFEIPKILKHPQAKKTEISQKIETGIKAKEDSNIESQLMEIQRKLKELSG